MVLQVEYVGAQITGALKLSVESGILQNQIQTSSITPTHDQRRKYR